MPTDPAGASEPPCPVAVPSASEPLSPQIGASCRDAAGVACVDAATGTRPSWPAAAASGAGPASPSESSSPGPMKLPGRAAASASTRCASSASIASEPSTSRTSAESSCGWDEAGAGAACGGWASSNRKEVRVWLSAGHRPPLPQRMAVRNTAQASPIHCYPLLQLHLPTHSANPPTNTGSLTRMRSAGERS